MSIRSDINNFIDQFDGTAIGYEVKNMMDNGTDLEYICDYAGITYSPDEED